MRKNHRQRLSGLRRIFAALVTLTILSGTLTAAALAAPLPPEHGPAAAAELSAEEQQPVLHIHHAKELGSDQDEIQVTIRGKKYTGTLKRDVITVPVDEDSRLPDPDPGETVQIAFVNLTTGLKGTLTVETETGPDGTKKVTDDHVLAHYRCTTAKASDGTLLVSEEEPPEPADKPTPPEKAESPDEKPAKKPAPKDGPKAGPKADTGVKDGPKGPKND